MEKLFDVPLKMGIMYLRGKLEKKETVISGSLLSTDTYFGCLPCKAYSQNTTVENVKAGVKVKGLGLIELKHLDSDIDAVESKAEFNSDSYRTIFLATSLKQTGILYVKITGNFEVSDIWYESDGDVRSSKITVVICTYRREDYVLHNLEMLRKYANNNLEIICVDNGGTIVKVPEGVKLVQNRNFGGSGGYARGMIEAKDCTHFWLMDDDIKFEPEIIYRALSFFKHRNKEDICLAAGMFSFEEPTIQQEATAVFDGYTFHSNASGLNFGSQDALLKNDIRQNLNTYGGWWSLIMPATNELPMPFFIKLDDVEYGLRQHSRYVVMNGFGVWHEAFEKKGNAWSEYYTTRNALIIGTIHPKLKQNTVKLMGIRLLKALAYGEPKCMEAACRGATDYANGSELFRAVNPEQRHKQIMKMCSAPLAQDMSRKKMLKAALINVLKPKNWKSIALYFQSVKLLRNSSHDEGWKELNSIQFWKYYLGLK